MKIARTERFKKAYQKLNQRQRRAVEKALSFLVSNIRHPSLRVKGVEGTTGVWEARASRSIRLSFEFRDDTLILRNVGAHDEVLRSP